MRGSGFSLSLIGLPGHLNSWFLVLILWVWSRMWGGEGVHWYRTLDFSNPSSLWLIPSAPVFKKWFITGESASLSSLHQLSSGEPLSCAPLSSDYLPLTKLLFVFTGAVQYAESSHRPEPAAEEEVSSADTQDERLVFLFYVVRCSPPDNNAPAPAEPVTLHTPPRHPNCAPCCWEGNQPHSALCVCHPPPDRGCELQQLGGQHMALSITSVEVKKREHCKTQPSSLDVI